MEPTPGQAAETSRKDQRGHGPGLSGSSLQVSHPSQSLQMPATFDSDVCVSQCVTVCPPWVRGALSDIKYSEGAGKTSCLKLLFGIVTLPSGL